MPKTSTKKPSIPSQPSEIARRIDATPVHDEMRDSFMPYALSVTTARAIPDVRDGLKPVQRRILFAMNALGLRPGEPFRKSAAVVGEVMGKYHPHGDSAIYEAMVRMGQPFAMSHTLVDPKGNFGSLDDPPAAYRYTEARLTAEAMTLVADIDEDTVDFVASFDDERKEPTCLPAALPNLLLNGASGIAVGMATSMAPHNLGEVIAVIKHVLTKQRPKPTVEALMKHLPAPDFPGGGLIVNDEALQTAYATGKGTVRVRARAAVEKATARRQRIVITELPYMVGPERVLTKIRELIQAGKLPAVGSVNDLSDRNSGLRLVVECRPGEGGQGVLGDLYRLTPLEDNFSINNVTLVDGVPATLNLYELCKHFIDHRLAVIVRRTQYRLDRANERCHIVEGLLKALDQLDEVIAIIRGSADVPTARKALIKQLAISEIQANHILELQLRRLTALEVSKLNEEMAELKAAISGYEKLLNSKTRQRTLLKKELEELAEKFATPRRSELISPEDLAAFNELAKADKATASSAKLGASGNLKLPTLSRPGPSRPGPNGSELASAAIGSTIVTLSTSGLLGRRAADDTFTAKPGRHDLIDISLETSTLDVVYAVTDRGRLLNVAAHSIPEMARGSRGASVTEMFSLSRGEKVVGLLAGADAIANSPTEANAKTKGSELAPIALVTRKGQVKRVAREALSARRRISSLVNLATDDRVVAAFDAPDEAELVMIASNGLTLRTGASGIPKRGHGAGPVAGIRLKPGAEVVAAGLLEFSSLAVLVTDSGAVKVTALSDLKGAGRATGGVPAIAFPSELPGKPPGEVPGDSPDTAVVSAWIGRAEAAAVFVELEQLSTTPLRLSPLQATEPKTPAVHLRGIVEGETVQIVTDEEIVTDEQIANEEQTVANDDEAIPLPVRAVGECRGE